MMSISYGRASQLKDLKDILALQQENLPERLSEETALREGFVTVSHPLFLLQKMNEVCPHIIAMDRERLVGYALCMHPEFSTEIPVLVPMFREIEELLPDTNYIVMGQICIDKEYRGLGIFRGLYQTMKNELREDFELIVTEVDGRNTRSLDAHFAIGFNTIKKYQSDGRDWYLIVL
jgi:GNAT superfamily N-acetyltransferase